MLFSNPRRLLSEAASADLLNPEVSEEVKDVIEELEEDLTNNIEEVKDEDKTTNGGIPVTEQTAVLFESNVGYDKAKYLLKIEDVIALKEAEGEEAAAAAMEEPGQAPSEEEVAAHEPPAENVVEKIADANGVEPEDVAIVISTENVKFLAETALLEARAGRKGPAGKKAKKIKDTLEELKGKFKVVKAK